jgi:ketosteroid isomerase-like protein
LPVELDHDGSSVNRSVFWFHRPETLADRIRGRVVATGVPFDIPGVHRWTVRDGRAVAAHFRIDTPAMLTALSSGRS